MIYLLFIIRFELKSKNIPTFQALLRMERHVSKAAREKRVDEVLLEVLEYKYYMNGS